MKTTLRRQLTIFALTACAFLSFNTQEAQALRNRSSLKSAANMAQSRFTFKASFRAMQIPEKVYAEDILIICEGLDRGNSLQEVANILIPIYANDFKDYALAVHYFESVAKHGAMTYCSEHMVQVMDIGF
ncbi:hypothetical protein FNW02_14610 [Komarekiella sp. 'clone 1']|uniref:Uncharacterized protein n=1 Tax=Komarekiella delphini-convector SJRDD-AB1 TaxID=2593771 RepID=A0AA40SXR9_9NOST|nr:hypothetical protein [Komarekiella delphini-convector]MBD6617030.1 hypothetical protein [Komarekiella delphini-convector SJRDD-AB1]